jgi:hypothetical protein
MQTNQCDMIQMKSKSARRKLNICPLCGHRAEVYTDSVFCFSCGYVTVASYPPAQKTRPFFRSFAKRRKWKGISRVWIPIRAVIRNNEIITRLYPVKIGRRFVWRRTVRYGRKQCYADYQNFSQALRASPSDVLMRALRRAYRQAGTKLQIRVHNSAKTAPR